MLKTWYLDWKGSLSSVYLYTIRGKEREAERQSEIEKEEKDRVIIFFLLG